MLQNYRHVYKVHAKEQMRLYKSDCKSTCFPHPALDEIIHHKNLQLGTDLHDSQRCSPGQHYPIRNRAPKQHGKRIKQFIGLQFSQSSREISALKIDSDEMKR